MFVCSSLGTMTFSHAADVLSSTQYRPPSSRKGDEKSLKKNIEAANIHQGHVGQIEELE